MGLAEPLRTEPVTHFLVGSRGEDQVARRLEPFTRKRGERNSAGGDLSLHVEGAATPHLPVTQLTPERIRAPLRRVCEHDVGVREEEQRRPFAATRYARNEVRAFGHTRIQVHLCAALLEVLAQNLRRRGLVARRVGRVDADQILQELGDLVAQRDRDAHVNLPLPVHGPSAGSCARQSAGKKLWWIIFPSTSTGVPCVPTTWSPMILDTTL